ncbi:hypothetical protein D3C80_1749090 [compost metagenome]
MRRSRIKPVNIRQQNQKVGSSHRCNAGGKTVVVAITDFGCRDRIVFIDDRDRADLQKLIDRGTRVEIPPAFFRIRQRQQNLSCNNIMP